MCKVEYIVLNNILLKEMKQIKGHFNYPKAKHKTREILS